MMKKRNIYDVLAQEAICWAETVSDGNETISDFRRKQLIAREMARLVTTITDPGGLAQLAFETCQQIVEDYEQWRASMDGYCEMPDSKAKSVEMAYKVIANLPKK
jgi:hypothetical protein